MNKDKIKEYVKIFEAGCSNTQDAGPASSCEECLEAFAKAVDRLYNSPSSDFTIPKENPYQTYLMWYKPWGLWYKGFFNYEGDLYTEGECFEGNWQGVFTHWLPLPEAPNNRPNE